MESPASRGAFFKWLRGETDRPDICAAFPIGKAGTIREYMDMVRCAGIPVLNFGDPDPNADAKQSRYPAVPRQPTRSGRVNVRQGNYISRKANAS